jgi:hypothetical protein
MVQNQACLAMFQSFCPPVLLRLDGTRTRGNDKELEAMLYKVVLARVMVMVISQDAITVLPANEDRNTWMALKATTYVSSTLKS